MAERLDDLPIEEQLRLLREQEDVERRGRVGPLGGNRYDSRDVDALKKWGDRWLDKLRDKLRTIG